MGLLDEMIVNTDREIAKMKQKRYAENAARQAALAQQQAANLEAARQEASRRYQMNNR